jgi:transcriptional regulator with XRE-family HTH domain
MDKKILLKLGSRIRDKRKSLGLSQELLAEKANIDRSYMGGIERGERNITFLILCKICQALEIDIASITKNLPE